jgi:hypothetical protein
MISDLTLSSGGNLPASNVPRGSGEPSRANALQAAFGGQAGALQPVKDVPAYLTTRTPQPEIQGEECLLITLPARLQTEVKSLVRACLFVRDLVKQKWSVQSACKNALSVFDRWGWKLATFRQKYDLWALKRDWIVLVNLAKAPAAWKAGSAGMPMNFLLHCEEKFGRFAREDGKRQALLSIQRHWRTGRDEDGADRPVPGYEAGWNNRDRENFPVGWSYTNITRQIKKRARFTKATRAMLHEGESAARGFLPQALGSRRGLRFLEKITFDDVRMDWLVVNTETGAAEELWLLVARDEATAMVLGFVMHPATVREDPVTGTSKATHLGARQMKELAAYLLERYPLPPYVVHWVVERGTATLAEGVKAALGELFNDRIKVHYTSMIGGLSPTGYAEKRKGNSRGKASHEAHNRLFHTQASFIEGQTGANWGIRPADLDARVKECQEIYQQSRTLPAEKRAELQWPLLTLAQAREKFSQLCHEQNARTDHKLEDFEPVVEVWSNDRWEVVASAPAGVECRTRMERPLERAMRLIRSVERWDKISPDIIRTFLDHTERRVEVEPNGEVKFMHEGKVLIFRNAGNPLPPGTKALAYHHPGDPQFLHLTSGDGRILGTWALRGRGVFQDDQALAEAMRYTHAAREAAKGIAADLATPQRERLDAMRANNQRIMDEQAQPFTEITSAPGANGAVGGTAVAAGLSGVAGQKAADAQHAKAMKNFKGSVEDLVADEGQESTDGDDDFSPEGLL